jgi:hypothetical protein
MQSFANKYAESSSDLFEIGRGGGGTVYLDAEQSDVVFKVSNSKTSCRGMSREYLMFERMEQEAKIVDEIVTPRVDIVKLYEYTNLLGNAGCILRLQRIYPLFENKHQRSVHALFGTPTSDVLHRNRGYFYGKQELENFIENIGEAIFELGQKMAYLHYFLKNDGYDIEVLAGREHPDSEPKLFIIDFDLTEHIESYDDRSRERMADSLSAVPYFPMPEDEHFDKFIDGYTLVAKIAGRGDIAEKVISKYISDTTL